MEETQAHSCRDDHQLASNIAQYGLSVILIEASDYLPSFAYSIGLWQNYTHPEVICFGLSLETLHATLNAVAGLVKSGGAMEVNQRYSDFFEQADALFLTVDERNIRDYFGTAMDYYGAKDFPALQLVWPDQNGKFPWEAECDQRLTHLQPLLDRNAEFKFREEKNLATFTTRQWLEHKKPITHVIHDADGNWLFLTGDQIASDMRMVTLEQLVVSDKTLNDVFDLEYGEEATRLRTGGEWTRYKAAE